MEITQRMILDRIAERLGHPPLCLACGSSHLIGPDVVAQAVVQGPIGQVVIGGPQVVSAVLSCGRCGAEQRFSLVALGLVPDSGGRLRQPAPEPPSYPDADRIL